MQLQRVAAGGHVGDVYPLAVQVPPVHVPAVGGNPLRPGRARVPHVPAVLGADAVLEAEAGLVTRSHLGPVWCGAVELVADQVLYGVVVVVAGVPQPLVRLESGEGVGPAPVHGLAAEPEELHEAVGRLGVGGLCQAPVPHGALYVIDGLHVEVRV